MRPITALLLLVSIMFQAEIHSVAGGHFALDTAADEIARLVAAFVK
jgi:hypothetical protein